MKDKIKALDGANSVKKFFRENDVTNLSRQEKYDLLVKIAELDTTFQLSSFANIILDSFKSHGEGFRYWIPILISNVIAIAALIVSIMKP